MVLRRLPLGRWALLAFFLFVLGRALRSFEGG